MTNLLLLSKRNRHFFFFSLTKDYCNKQMKINKDIILFPDLNHKSQNAITINLHHASEAVVVVVYN